jgi:rubredoxin
MPDYLCGICGDLYEPSQGIPEAHIPPGTAFENLPADWVRPICGTGKDHFMTVGRTMAIRKIIHFFLHQRGGNPKGDPFAEWSQMGIPVDEVSLAAELPRNPEALNPWTRSMHYSPKKLRIS